MLTASHKYVDKSEIPEIDPDTPFNLLTTKLCEKNQNGFIVRLGNRSVYVDARQLIKHILDKEDPVNRGAELAARSVGELVQAEREKNVVTHVEPAKSVESPPESLQQTNQEFVFPIVDASGVQKGWFLNTDRLYATLTGRNLWECSNGHVNAEYNKGRCTKCPANVSPKA